MLTTLKILADPTRLRLLRILQQGDFTVQDLTQILNMGQSRISRHLKLMVNEGLLQLEKQGTWHYYQLAPTNAFFLAIRSEVENRLKELSDYKQDIAAMLHITAERRQRNKKFFNSHAKNWDLMHDKWLVLPNYQVELLKQIPQGGFIVEIGVGTGRLLPLLAAKGDHVIGIDHSTEMIEIARELVNRSNKSNIDVRLAEMVHLPFVDNSIDTVVMNQVLHHAELPSRVLKEVHRILKPKGVFAVADLKRHDQDWMREQLADQWLGFSETQLSDWLTQTGFEMDDFKVIGRSDQNRVLLVTAKKMPTTLS